MDFTIHVNGSVVLVTVLGAGFGLLVGLLSLMFQEFASFGGISSIADRVTLETGLKTVLLFMSTFGLVAFSVSILITLVF